jgi:phage baseplate assembly protein W
MPDGTLLYQEFEALDLVDATEARFLSSAVRDAVREAQRNGHYDARFHLYRVRAWREPLGSRLVTVSWRLTHADQPVAGDTYILQAP